MIELPPNLIHAVSTQSAVLFLGAGASKGAHHPKSQQIPSGAELRDRIADRFLGGALKNRPLAEVSELATSESSLVDLQLFVTEILAEFTPDSFHQLVSTFRWHGIASANLDNIMELAYARAQEPLQTLVPFVKNGERIETEMKKHVNGVQLLKLHGSISHYNDADIPFILSTEQYVKYRKNRSRLFERLQDWGTEFPIIFCGYSIADPNIQIILFDLFDLERKRPAYYVVLPDINDIESRYWTSRRIFPIKATFKEFLEALDRAIPVANRRLQAVVGAGLSSLSGFYKLTGVTESPTLLALVANDVWHVRQGMPTATVEPKEFYKGYDNAWSGVAQNLDVPRGVTDSLIVEAILVDEAQRGSRTELFVLKGAAGNGKTVALKRAAWWAAHDYGKLVLFARPGGTLRADAISEIYDYTGQRIFLFVDHTSLWVDEIRKLLNFASMRSIPLSIITAEREAEWNVRCEVLDDHVTRDFLVRYLSEREIRELLRKLEEHRSLGLLAELTFEERVKAFTERAQRQLLVALHETTQGKPFEEIVAEEYVRIIPREAQLLYLDVCTLNRLGVPVRAGLVSRVSGISFDDFKGRFFRPLEYIVASRRDEYIGDWVYSARHQRVAEIVFETQVVDPEEKYDQLVRIMGGMNLDYSSDRTAFGQFVRGHVVKETFKSQELGRRFYDAALSISGREAYVYQQRAIFEMEHIGGDLRKADEYLEIASALEPHDKSIQHSRANLARRQALSTSNPVLRKQLRDKAWSRLTGLNTSTTEHSYGFHTAAQLALDDLKDVLEGIDADSRDALLERQIVERARDVERYIQEGLQKFPLNEHLLTLESDYRALMKQSRAALTALRQAFAANPRLDWIAARLAKSLVEAGDVPGAKEVLARCLIENPSSKKAHFEMAMLLLLHPEIADGSMILEHLRRAFTQGDHNYDAQFWFARQLYLMHEYPQAKEVFSILRESPVPPKSKNQIRGVIANEDGSEKVFRGIVATREESYMFVTVAGLPENIFAHRSSVAEDSWGDMRRGSEVAIVVGFTMKGPTAALVRPV